MLKLLSRLLVIGLIAFALILFFGGQFFANAGNALINAINGSAVHGLAQVVTNTSTNTSDVQINLQGLAPKSHYYVTLDQNSCGGPVVRDVGTVTTDENGNVMATFMVPDVSKLAQQTLWVDVHQGPDKSSQAAGCGQVQLNNTSTSHVNLTGSTSSTSSSTVSSSVPSGISNTGGSHSTHLGNQDPSDPGLPNSGVAPRGSNSYDNYTFPRKY